MDGRTDRLSSPRSAGPLRAWRAMLRCGNCGAPHVDDDAPAAWAEAGLGVHRRPRVSEKFAPHVPGSEAIGINLRRCRFPQLGPVWMREVKDLKFRIDFERCPLPFERAAPMSWGLPVRDGLIVATPHIC